MSVERFYSERAFYDEVWFFSLVFTRFSTVGEIVGDETYVRHIAVETRGVQRRENGISIASFNFTTASIVTPTSWTMRDCWSDDAVP